MKLSSRAQVWLGVAVLALAATVSVTFGAARRNWEYLRLLHGQLDSAAAGDTHASGTTRSDHRLDLRIALAHSDWPAAGRLLEQLASPDRLAALLVVHEAERRVQKDPDGAHAALGLFDPTGRYDAIVWYRVGATYGLLNDPANAVRAYGNGAAIDPLSPWSEGRYQIALSYRRQEKWQAVVNVLGAQLKAASDDDLRRRIQPLARGGPAWQGTFVALGEAYEQLGNRVDAEATYRRIIGLRSAQHDWTLNRAFAYLSRLESERGDFDAALRHLARALDLAETAEQSRREYETDTATRADHLIQAAKDQGRLSDLAQLSDALTQQSDRSSGAWYLRGLIAEAACDLPLAETAYSRARALAPAGTGTFLGGRPSANRRSACGRQ